MLEGDRLRIADLSCCLPREVVDHFQFLPERAAACMDVDGDDVISVFDGEINSPYMLPLPTDRLTAATRPLISVGVYGRSAPPRCRTARRPGACQPVATEAKPKEEATDGRTARSLPTVINRATAGRPATVFSPPGRQTESVAEIRHSKLSRADDDVADDGAATAGISFSKAFGEIIGSCAISRST